MRILSLLLLLVTCAALAADAIPLVDPVVPVPLSQLNALTEENKQLRTKLVEYGDLMGRAAAVMQKMLDKLKMSQKMECA